MEKAVAKALVSIFLGVGVVIGSLWFMNKSLLGTQHEGILTWLPLVFVVSVLVGTFVTMQYSKARWYKRFDQFVKNYSAWVVLALAAGFIVWCILIK